MNLVSRLEIKKWYKGFIKDCPTGQLTRSDFNEIYAQFFPHGNCDHFASLVFNVFDADMSGEIDFTEFLKALSVTQRGNSQDKIDCKLWSVR